MKKKNRSIWLITGVLIMLIAGSVYTWTIISRSIAATFPDWSAQTLSMTFTITMMGYAAGGMVSGVLLKKTGPKVILALGAVLFSGGMMLSSFAQTPGLLYIGFGAMCGLATGLCYNSTVSTVSAWFPDMQGVAELSSCAPREREKRLLQLAAPAGAPLRKRKRAGNLQAISLQRRWSGRVLSGSSISGSRF